MKNRELKSSITRKLLVIMSVSPIMLGTVLYSQTAEASSETPVISQSVEQESQSAELKGSSSVEDMCYVNVEGWDLQEGMPLYTDLYTVKKGEELVYHAREVEGYRLLTPESTKKMIVDKNEAFIAFNYEKIKPETPQGDYIADGRYVTVTNSNYNTWSNFSWKYRQSGKDLYNKTFQAKGRYEHENGATYYSLYDEKGIWYGYINEKGVKVGNGKEGAYIGYNKYVTITSKSYNTWSNFSWKYKQSADLITNKTYLAKGKYHHINGSTYLSLYDNQGTWYGYINEKAGKVANGKEGVYIADGRKVKVVNKNYNTWSNFSWKYRQSTKNMYGKTYTARGRYEHANGTTYYSLFDNSGKWQGYLNSSATK
ncbi:hypothetical protein [Vagococcus hydrophili]|uniref:Uncharacterized protein n=1 Tax=Vagococcus hydrophili TaxID=2714947 RepID=A0A6G8ATU1_9ENTE|nr:hypothetical protein [Vagococcus hydrophili]QIL48355.1 hypothetical protein G7082_07535 [Vagococcus hydrophili]